MSRREERRRKQCGGRPDFQLSHILDVLNSVLHCSRCKLSFFFLPLADRQDGPDGSFGVDPARVSVVHPVLLPGCSVIRDRIRQVVQRQRERTGQSRPGYSVPAPAPGSTGSLCSPRPASARIFSASSCYGSGDVISAKSSLWWMRGG